MFKDFLKSITKDYLDYTMTKIAGKSIPRVIPKVFFNETRDIIMERLKDITYMDIDSIVSILTDTMPYGTYCFVVSRDNLPWSNIIIYPFQIIKHLNIKQLWVLRFLGIEDKIVLEHIERLTK